MAGSILSMSLILNISDFIGISDWHSTLVFLGKEVPGSPR